MFTSANPSAPASRSAGRQPSHRVYCVIGNGRGARWTALGAAWVNKDGLGFNLSCDALPIQGRIVLRAVGAKGQMRGGRS